MTPVGADAAPKLRLGLSDIALLARVRRPVVSVWRTRSAGTAHPFPPSVAEAREQERFDAGEVVEWLARTGRGNNPSAAADVAAFAVVPGRRDQDPALFGVLTALIALRAGVERLPTTAAELLDLADETDPDDDVLYSEIDSAGKDLAALARYADLLAEASFGAAAALDKLVADRARHVPVFRDGLLAPAGVDLLASMVAVLARRLGASAIRDVTGGAAPVLVRAATENSEPLLVTGPESRNAGARLAARVLLAHGLSWRASASARLVLLGFPTVERPNPTNLEVLQAVRAHLDHAAAQTVTLIWGPASALTDALPSAGRAATDMDLAAEALRRRLTGDSLRAVIRLPAGLLLGRARSRLALWCIGPTDEQPARTIQGDLSDATLDERTVSALVTDLLAGLGGRWGASAHQAALTRAPVTRALAAAPGRLVEVAPARDAPDPPAALLSRFESATQHVRRPLPGLAAYRATSRRSPLSVERLPVASCLTTGRLRYIPGLRIDSDLPDAESGAELVDLARLTSGVASRRVDRVALQLEYPQFSYAEPGDVAFATVGRPTAAVIRRPGCVVRYPVRLLRPLMSEIVPDVLARQINARRPNEKSWRSWPVPIIPTDIAPGMTCFADAVAAEREAVAFRLAALDELVAATVDLGVSGAFDLHPADQED